MRYAYHIPMKKPSPARKIFGFTLLELLVVISIIGILVAIGAASFSVAQRQGRNARRRGDMKAFQNCMEQQRAIATSYTASGTCDDGLSDPGTTTYTYQTAASNAGYCATGVLEGGGGNCGGCTSGAPTTGTSNFCVSNLQ